MSFPFKINPIYKINSITDEETISKIVVFYGNYNSDGDEEENPDLNTLFKQSPKHVSFIDKNSGLPIFTDDELAKINSCAKRETAGSTVIRHPQFCSSEEIVTDPNGYQVPGNEFHAGNQMIHGQGNILTCLFKDGCVIW